MSSVDTHLNVVIEAPMGTGMTVVHLDGRVEHIPFISHQIDWKAFEEAVCKINKLKDEQE